MPDTPIEPTVPGPYDPSLETRVSRLEEDMREVKSTTGRLETMVIDLRQAVTRIEATLTATLPHLATKAEVAEILKTLPHLATKAEVAELRADLAEKPSRMYLWAVLAALCTAYASGLALLALVK
jgi:hypothetical protein